MLKRIIPWLVPLIFLASWELAVYYQILPRAQAASPSQIIARLVQLISEGQLVRLSFFSLGRLMLAVSMGSLIGVIVGIWIALTPIAERFLGATLHFIVGLPVVIWIPFAVMVFGTDEAFKIGLTALSTFFLVYAHVFQATRSIRQEYLEVAALFEKGIIETVQDIILPALLPTLFTTIRTVLGLAWIILFFVEYASATTGREGIGWFIANARAVGRIEDEFAGLLVLGLLAYVIDIAVSKIQRYLTRWENTLSTKLVEVGHA